jgi:hypothetical protein
MTQGERRMTTLTESKRKKRQQKEALLKRGKKLLNHF